MQDTRQALPGIWCGERDVESFGHLICSIKFMLGLKKYIFFSEFCNFRTEFVEKLLWLEDFTTTLAIEYRLIMLCLQVLVYADGGFCWKEVEGMSVSLNLLVSFARNAL